MIQKMPITTLIAAVQSTVETATKHRCYDAVPDDAQAPFYFVEVVSVSPKNAKNMLVDSFNLYIHCIATQTDSSVPVHTLIHELQESLTNNITLDDPYRILNVWDNGVIVIKTDETGEKHAIVSLTFDCIYGFICK